VAILLDPLTNTSAVNLNHPTDLHYMHSINISTVFLVCSGLVAFFALSTFQMIQQGIPNVGNISHEEFVCGNAEFVHDPTVLLWNNVFLALVIITHEVVLAVICTPNSMHFLIMMALVFYVSFSVILQPKLQAPSDLPGAAASVSYAYMVAVTFYVVGMFYVCGNISFDPLQYKVQFVTALIFVDAFLILGHIWDPTPLMSTIINCRFMYTVCIIVMNVVIYFMWERWLKIPYVRI
jgi:hypothetical protein